MSFNEPKLAELTFYSNFETLAKALSDRVTPTVAFVPYSYAERVVLDFPELAVVAFGPSLYLRESFGAGIRDYLKEPWDAIEFWIRVSRHLNPDVYRLTWAEIIADGNRTVVSGIELNMRTGCHRLMQFLLRGRGKICQRKHLLLALGRDSLDSRLVDVGIAEIRKVLTSVLGYSADHVIVSHRGDGYMLVV